MPLIFIVIVKSLSNYIFYAQWHRYQLYLVSSSYLVIIIIIKIIIIIIKIIIIISATKQAVRMKTTKYQELIASHIFCPIAIETADSWDEEAVRLIEDISRQTTQETEDPRETIYLFQKISIAVQRGNALSFTNTFNTDNT